MSSNTRGHGAIGSHQTLVLLGIMAFLYFAAEVLKPLALAVLLAFALTPASRRLERLGLPRAAGVMLTVVLVLALLGGAGYFVGQQFASLAVELPNYQGNIERKLKNVLRPEKTTTGERLMEMVDEVASKLEPPAKDARDSWETIPKVQVVSLPSLQERLRSSSGPYVEFLGVSSFVLVIVLFMLMSRDDLRDRIVVLFGHRHVGLTTRTLEEISERISRYLATVTLVNSGFGVVIGLGLALIGLPYSFLWGCLAGIFRFIPYIGPTAALGLPLLFSVAHFPGWIQPIEILGFFCCVEIFLNSFLEPVVYGKSTGVSAIGLLIAAMFWTWLWGILGLLLSTPLTVCLSVIGKYVPSLNFLATLLGEEPEMSADLRFYQRLVALDEEQAVRVFDKAREGLSTEAVFDQILLPTLTRAEIDSNRGEFDESEQRFAWSVIEDILDRLESGSESEQAGVDLVKESEDRDGTPAFRVAGIAQTPADTLVFRMLTQSLRSSGVEIRVLSTSDSMLVIGEALGELAPSLVLVSQFPGSGIASSRYLVRRVQVQCPDCPIVVGWWNRKSSSQTSTVRQRLRRAGAVNVVSSIEEARVWVLRRACPVDFPVTDAAPLPS